jgi:hypothetical protein
MLPESKLIEKELSLRILSINEETLLTKKAMLRWLALSLGFVSPNESRTFFLDVFGSVLTLVLKEKNPTSQDIINDVLATTQEKKPSEKLIRYHLTRLVDSGLITRKGLRYSLVSSQDSGTPNLSKAIEILVNQKSEALLQRTHKICDVLEQELKK